MKKKIALLCLLSVITLSACDRNGYYEEGYTAGYYDGYSQGRSDTRSEYEDDYSRGFDDGRVEGYRDGYSDYKQDIPDLVEEAEWFASDQSGCSPMEALDIIGVYRDPDNPLYADIIISEEEYQQAVDSLMYFYDYLD